jgi:hypothetical protein
MTELDDDRDYDADLLREAWLERRRRYRLLWGPCVCGDDLPGRCPGRENCPYAQEDEDE